MGILPDGKTIILAWFSTMTEDGREPAYAGCGLGEKIVHQMNIMI